MSAGRGAALLLLAATLPWPAAAEPLRHQPHCQRELFCLSADRHGERISLWIDSETAGPLTLAVALETRNLSGAVTPRRFTIRAPGRHRLALLRIGVEGDWSLAWTYSFHPGNAPARHAPETPYRLPYPSGESFAVIQGAEGDFSHQGPLAHAIDWSMPEGTPVLATRAGVVAGLRDGAAAGGPDPALAGQENFVWLRHADGTTGQYLHLQAGSIAVTIGETVEAGGQIARSGNSGYSTEPHLHFHVSTPAVSGGSAFESFPLVFALGGGKAEPLRAGEVYTAP